MLATAPRFHRLPGSATRWPAAGAGPIVVATLVCVGFTLGGCSLDLGDERAPIPGDYPQLGRFESGAVELVVGGVSLETDGSFLYDGSGVDMMRMRATGYFDGLTLDFRTIDAGAYAVSDGAAEASWSEEADWYFADSTCGAGTVTVAGGKSFDGLVDNFAFWGTLAFELCEGMPNNVGEGRLEISGKFSGAVTR